MKKLNILFASFLIMLLGISSSNAYEMTGNPNKDVSVYCVDKYGKRKKSTHIVKKKTRCLKKLAGGSCHKWAYAWKIHGVGPEYSEWFNAADLYCRRQGLN